METASFEYKCRLCGKTYQDGHCPKEIARVVLICTITGIPMPKQYFGIQPQLISLHAGCKNGHGVSDLIGYTVTGD